MQVLQVCSCSTFALPPAFPPCCCPLAFRRQVRRLTSRISSESHPGNQECVTNYHGAGEFTCVHHTVHPAPSPPDASRDTVPSRFGRQSGDCGYVVRGHLTARYLAAVPRRILLMEQQVWSILHARRSTLRPRVAVPSQKGHAPGLGLFSGAFGLHHGRLQRAGPVAWLTALRVGFRASLDSGI